MEKVFEKFKNLYKGEDRLKRHGMLLLLLLIPSLLGGLRYFADKDTPKELLIPLFCVLAVVLVLSIIPYFFLNGFMIDFCKGRIKSKVGLPEITGESFIKGLKVFPIQFVWGLYGCVLVGIVLGVPLAICVASGASHSVGGFIGGLLLLLVCYLILLVLLMMLAPFFNYIYFSFIEDFVYRAEYFNPLTLGYYIKSVFKPTILTMLKFLLAALIINTVVSTVVLLVCFISGIFAFMATSGDSTMYSPISIAILVPVCTLATLVQAYSTTIISFASADAYVDIYKEQVRLPDPAEKYEDNKDLSVNKDL